jgi:hypothetical protein
MLNKETIKIVNESATKWIAGDHYCCIYKRFLLINYLQKILTFNILSSIAVAARSRKRMKMMRLHNTAINSDCFCAPYAMFSTGWFVYTCTLSVGRGKTWRKRGWGLPDSVAEPEPELQGATSFGRSRIRSRNAVRLRLRLRRLRLRQ